MKRGWVIRKSRRYVIFDYLSNTHLTSSKTGKGIKKNPIYLFFESVSGNTGGSAGNPGDKHYRCYHGSHKIITITKGMNSNLNREY